MVPVIEITVRSQHDARLVLEKLVYFSMNSYVSVPEEGPSAWYKEADVIGVTNGLGKIHQSDDWFEYEIKTFV